MASAVWKSSKNGSGTDMNNSAPQAAVGYTRDKGKEYVVAFGRAHNRVISVVFHPVTMLGN